MKQRLKNRLREMAVGRVSPTDSARQIAADAYTDLLRMETEVEKLNEFVEFVRGWLYNNDLSDDWIKPLKVRLRSTDNDLKRAGLRRGCGGG